MYSPLSQVMDVMITIYRATPGLLVMLRRQTVPFMGLLAPLKYAGAKWLKEGAILGPFPVTSPQGLKTQRQLARPPRQKPRQWPPQYHPLHAAASTTHGLRVANRRCVHSHYRRHSHSLAQ